jgi:UDP-N-acetylmuramoyl-L-alanyl-D-glutamate--2,6-diaminopimelate ligase
MKKLHQLYNVKKDIDIRDIKTNSKLVTPGDLFVCIMGVTVDRHDFIEEAIKRGAKAIVVNRDVNYDIPTIKVSNPNDELNKLLIKFYDDPFKDLILIGITGTDGKTTLATIIQLLIGKDKCMYIGTNGVSYNDVTLDTLNTTPAIEEIYKYAYIARKAKLKYIVIEASSEAFFHNRLKDLLFDVSILTNITRDHLNVHKTIKNYLKCKSLLFKQTKNSGFSILNKKDKYFHYLKKICPGKVYTYGSKHTHIKLINYQNTNKGTLIKFQLNKRTYLINSPLIGCFNVDNLLASILLCDILKIDINRVINNINNIYVTGRLENLDFGQKYTVILDYAHTPNALLQVLKHFKKQKRNKIITLTGSAGGRDKEKRSIMGKIVLKYSDWVIFTMDDPRYEDPESIIKQMIGKIKKKNYEIIVDRGRAIKKSLTIAKKDDIVLILGKGRDNYMMIKDFKIPYCDYDIIKDYFDDKK